MRAELEAQQMQEHDIPVDGGGEYRPNDAFRRVLTAKRDLERRMGWGTEQ